MKISENFVSRTFLKSTGSLNATHHGWVAKKSLGSNCSRTPVSAFFKAYFNKLLPLNFVKILFFSGYNLKGIRVSLEISLTLFLLLLRFCFNLHLPFIVLTLRRVLRWELWVMSYDSDEFNYFMDFFSLFFTVGYFREFVNITYRRCCYFCQKYPKSDGYFHLCWPHPQRSN